MATNDELFYSFARYIRRTCFQHLDRPPLLAVCGGREGALHFALQAEPVLAVRVAAGLNKKSLQQLIRDYRHHRLDGAVILDNYKYQYTVLQKLTGAGMTLNENLFLFWCRI